MLLGVDLESENKDLKRFFSGEKIFSRAFSDKNKFWQIYSICGQMTHIVCGEKKYICFLI